MKIIIVILGVLGVVACLEATQSRARGINEFNCENIGNAAGEDASLCRNTEVRCVVLTTPMGGHNTALHCDWEARKL